MVAWRVYYGDGSTFDSDDGSAFDAPARDVQAIVVRDPDPTSQLGRYVVLRFDYYWWDGADWFGGEIFGLFDYLVGTGPKTVKFGRTIANATHAEIVQRAFDDPDFIRKPSR